MIAVMFHAIRPTCAPALSRSLGQLALAITLAAGTAAWQTEVAAARGSEAAGKAKQGQAKAKSDKDNKDKNASAGASEPDMCLVPPGAQPMLPAKLLPGMGDTDMAVTTKSDEARKFFNQGVSQLHNFWAIEAERSFLQAATLDPDMAMAYWGIAMSAAGDHRPAFQLRRDTNDGGRAKAAAGTKPEAIARTVNGAAIDGQIRAREAMQKAMSLRDKVTPRERLYIEAQWARRDPESHNRDRDYISGMRKVVAAHPDDLEAKSILGLALLDGFDSVTKEPRTNTMEGIALLEEIVKKDDKHFGGHHYIIHGYEGSKMPEKAWYACQRYPELVTNVPHALHMPGHIYAQSDRVADAVAAFTAAAENELTYLNGDVLYPNGHHGHNVHFLIHALNLDGRYRESMLQARSLLSFKETPRERTGANQRVTWRQGYYAMVKTLVRFERWDDILDGRTIPSYDKPEQLVWRHWAMGLAHSAKGNATEAKASLDALNAALKAVNATSEPLQIAALELEATIITRGGDRAAGYAIFRKAADKEAALIYTEPPSYPRPVVEGWAIVALALGDAATAETAYAEALAREPGSGRASFGRAAALDLLGKSDDARRAREAAAKAWQRADRDLPQLKQLAPTATAASIQQ
jgi:tetratricopeptide (TPR) repeat protein